MVGVVGAGAGLRVVLHAEHRLVAMGQGRHGAVVEVEVGDLHRVGRERCGINGETVVLAGDLHHAGAAAGMVEAAVAITQLVSAAAHGQPQDLVAEADPEHGQVALLQQSLGQGDA